MAFLIDSNVFIDAKNRYYDFIVCPGFWDWLLEAHGRGEVFSIEAVINELDTGGDDLTVWARANAGFFLPADAAVVASLATVSAWTMAAPNYSDAARNTFLAAADYHLVAHAHAQGHTVVTHEKSRPNAVKRVLIPDACAGMGVPVINPFEMLRAMGACFVKGP